MMKLFLFTSAISSHVFSALAAADEPFRQATNGSTPAGWIQLGTPKKWLFVIFDTGSDKLVAKTWETLAAELSTIDAGVTGMVLPSKLIYDHNASSSYKTTYTTDPATKAKTPLKSSITYGSGTAITDVGTETVLVGNRPLSNFTVMEITADSLQLLHTSKGIAGVLGLQHMKNRSLGDSLFSKMRDAELLTSFGYCRGVGNNGTFIWGDKSREGHELDVIGEMHWAMRLGNVDVKASENSSSLIANQASAQVRGNGDVDIWPFSDWGGDKSGHDDASQSLMNGCPDDSCTAILDTGSNIIAGPTDVIKNISKLIAIKPDCSNFDALPPITMKLGGMPVTIPPRGYVMKVPMPKWTASAMDGEGEDAGEGKDGNDEGTGDDGSGHGMDASQEGFAESHVSGGADVRIEFEPGFVRRHSPTIDDVSAGLGERSARKAAKRAGAKLQWQKVFDHLNRNYDIDLREMVGDALNMMNETNPDFMCMPALVPLDKHTKFGPLWVVGTPLLDAYYARWSFDKGAESPKIHLKPLDEAEVCKDDEGTHTGDSAPGLMRTQKVVDAADADAVDATRIRNRGPTERHPHEISYPHWAKDLAHV